MDICIYVPMPAKSHTNHRIDRIMMKDNKLNKKESVITVNIFGQPKMHAKWNTFHCETPIKFHQHIFECDSGQFPCFPFLFFVFFVVVVENRIYREFRRLNDIHENVSFCRLCVVLMISQKFVLEAGLSGYRRGGNFTQH